MPFPDNHGLSGHWSAAAVLGLALFACSAPAADEPDGGRLERMLGALKNRPGFEAMRAQHPRLVRLPRHDTFYVVWFPPDFTTRAFRPLVVTLHGSEGTVVEEFNRVHEQCAKRGWGLLALQWWLGDDTYLEAETVYGILHTAIEEAYAAQKVERGHVLFHGFERASVESYGYMLIDQSVSGKKHFMVCICNAGGVPPQGQGNRFVQALRDGKLDRHCLAGKLFIMYGGAKDPDRDLYGITGMTRAQRLVEEHGGQVMLFFKDALYGRNGFVRNPEYLPKALDFFAELLENRAHIRGIEERLAADTTQVDLLEGGDFAWSDDFLLSQEGTKGSVATIRGRALQVDGEAVHAVWQSVRRESDSDVHYRRSLDGGQTWDEVQALTELRDRKMYPVVDVSGTIVRVAWVWDTALGKQICFARSQDSGVRWFHQTQVTHSSDLANLCGMAQSEEILHLIWQETGKAGRNVFQSVSDKTGGSWSPKRNITCAPSPVNEGAAFVTAGEGRRLHIVFASDRHAAASNGHNWEIGYLGSTDQGRTWPNRARLTQDGTSDSRLPVIAAAGSTLHVLWADDRDDTRYPHDGAPRHEPEPDHNYEIYYKRSDDNGATWARSVRLTEAPGISVNPAIAVCGRNVYVAWQDSRSGTYEIFFKYSPDGGKTWSQDAKITNVGGVSRYPSIQVDAAGTAYFLWSDSRSGTSEVYFKKGRPQR
ncbi:MAG: exo-alpha-sialidase [Kiritimatiellae bacterium]|nr:exo-alpha-sialidase [Kiritimatiellia bacterium]